MVGAPPEPVTSTAEAGRKVEALHPSVGRASEVQTGRRLEQGQKSVHSRQADGHRGGPESRCAAQPGGAVLRVLVMQGPPGTWGSFPRCKRALWSLWAQLLYLTIGTNCKGRTCQRQDV